MRAAGAPPPLPDLLSTPVQRPAWFPPPTTPNPITPQTAVLGDVEIWPWWLTEWAAAQDWSCAAVSAAIAASVVTVVPATFKYTVPTDFSAVIKSLTIIVVAPTTSMNLTLTLLKNNGPIQGWTNRMVAPGSGASEAITFNGMAVRLQQNEFLTAQFTEGGGSTWTVSLEASGWQIPNREILRVQQGVSY